MFFTKYPHPANFSFVDPGRSSGGTIALGGREFQVSVESFAGDVFRVRVANPDRWRANQCLQPLDPPEAVEAGRLRVGEDFALELAGKDGAPLLRSVPGKGFGVSGEASLFQFELPAGARFYGMGEKNFAEFELSGYRTKFWNTDVWGDFPAAQWGSNPVDPPYFTTPYVVAKIGDEYVGFLLDNPYPTFIETPGMDESRVFVEWQRTSPNLLLGSEGGEPNLWILYGPTLREVTRKLQKLVGVTPLPPLWALGYHQSRWGYGGHDDLMALDAQFAKYKIPCDALWMDLDYMDGYRIFTTSDKAFPGGAQITADALAKNGRRIVPIIDPGVKFETGYAVYDDGHAQSVFCQNPEGREFVGLVWPGETVFPDFSLPRVREWWAGYAERFRREGYGAAWIDMNDPSTGPVDPTGMRFEEGQVPHAAHHNQYALGMQRATREGFLRAAPDERPFLLSRSGFTGSSRYSAIWTGDNLSNYFYLKMAIPTSLGLSLSGLPFNGPDLGGFGGDVTDELMVDWTKAGFLFPFLRNHCGRGQRNQEPFNFPTPTMNVVRRYIRLRYKLLPYLYNLFIDQEELGEPVLRPLLYEFEGESLERLGDQFLVGPSILQAPFVAPEAKTRKVVLPGEDPWYDAGSGRWIAPGEAVAKREREGTPLYIRAGAILPMQPGTPTDARKDLREVHLHVFVPADWSGERKYTYRADDGLSYGYRRGERSELRIDLVAVDGHIAIATEAGPTGFGEIHPTFVFHGPPRSVRLNGVDAPVAEEKATLTGRALPVAVIAP